VHQGEQIGVIGSTGWSTGPHLHFEVRRDGVVVDPMTWLTR
jgi:murein DD-endopeptidase MepM/ murein hydrolase activator NlpD